MKIFLILITVLGLTLPAVAQPGAELSLPITPQAQREQRRIELRNALQTQHISADTQQARDVRHQLSPQEKEELRQQLRQFPEQSSKPRS